MSLPSSPPLLVTAQQDDGGELRIRVSGSAPDSQVRRFRELVGAALHDGPDPLVLDLQALADWGHEAQAALLHLVRAQRHGGRSVVVEGLHGRAARQADESGMHHLLRSTGRDVGLSGPSIPEPGTRPAQAGTLARIAHDRKGRRPTVHATCEFGHAAGAGGDHCDQGHLILPL